MQMQLHTNQKDLKKKTVFYEKRSSVQWENSS